MKIALIILAFAVLSFAAPLPPKAPEQVTADTTAAKTCRAAFDEVKNTHPKDAAAKRLYAEIEGRIIALDAEKEKPSATYNAEIKNCNLAVELFKKQLSNVALRKSLDSLNQQNFATQKQISAIKDSLIDLWTDDAKGAKSLNATLSDERNRLERLTKENALKDSTEKARLAAEKAKLEKALAQKDSLLAKQKAEADKKLEALRSQTISVFKDARGTILSMSDILFETAKADLKPELKENLAEVAAILKTLLTESNIIVEGHTDNTGSAKLNLNLSRQRAEAVLKYLEERGVDKKRMKAVGYGLTKPIADNKTEEGRAKNRRVELVIKE